MTAPLSLREEEMLAEIVKMYPVLYDKQVKGYKEKDVITHVWEDVAKALDFVENSKHVVIFSCQNVCFFKEAGGLFCCADSRLNFFLFIFLTDNSPHAL